MLYSLLKLIFRTALRIFYKRLKVKNKELLPASGPLLVVSNHPNTMMDPVAIGAVMRQELFFIAKSILFGSPFRTWLLTRMNLIPIYRREDAGGAANSNEEAFRKCYDFLARQGTLLIFPEGNSFNERRLRPLKTGAARLALGAEDRQNFKAGVLILPIGLNYSSPTRFRSDLFINIGEPIRVADLKEKYRQNPTQAIQFLTDLIRSRLEELIIHTPTEAEDDLLHKVEAIYKNQLLAEFNLSPQKKEEEFLLTKGIGDSIRYFRERQPERLHRLKQQIDGYLADLHRLRLRDDLLQEGPDNRNLVKDSLQTLLFLLLGFPVYLYGLLHNYIPYKIPALVADALTEEEEFVAPIMMTTGTFTFPLFYALYLIGAYHAFFQSGLLLLFAYFLTLPLSGFFALRYWHRLRQTLGHLTLFSLFYNRSTLLSTLLQQRLAIIKALEEAKQEYLLLIKDGLSPGPAVPKAPPSPPF
jgi:glycerol-3-phosphate O-acyltransferase/dihydroxyacetone phosphate acyltransferase